ncbi:MAG: WD40 repeat domain-containing protein, partial [Planctomycetia bacterium]
MAVSFADADVLQTVEEGGVLRRWNASTGGLLDVDDPFVPCVMSDIETCWAFSSDGRLLVSGGPDGLSLWDPERGSLTSHMRSPALPLTVCFSADGRLLASGHDDHVVRVWRTSDGQLVHSFDGHRDEICALSFNHDGTQLASAGEDRLVFIWRVPTGALHGKLLGHTDRIDGLAWNADSSRLVSAGWDTSVRVWDPATCELLAMLNGQGECVHAVQFLSESGLLACGDSEAVVRVWDYERLKVLTELRRHAGPVKRLALSADGRTLATGGADRLVQLWSLAGGRPNWTDASPSTPVARIAVLGSATLVVLPEEGSLYAWDVATSAKISVWASNSPVVSLASAGAAGRWAVGLADGDLAVGVGPS